MLHYDRIDVFERIDVNMMSESKEFSVFHSSYFYWKFQTDACNGRYDVLMMFLNLGKIVILNIHGIDYCWIISKN